MPRRIHIVTFSSATLTLIALNVLMFLLELIPGFTDALVLDSSRALLEPWRIITSMFLHAGFTHLFFNMYALMLFGPLIESRVGTRRFYQYYFLAGIVAALAFIFFEPTGLAVGASGAIMGILGMVIMLFPHMQVLFFFIIPMSMRTAGIIFALIDILGFIGVGPGGVANIAHLGGLAVGLALGYYLKRKKTEFQSRFSRSGASFSDGGEDPFGSGDTNRRHQYARRAQSSTKDNKTIELTEDEIDSYFKYGRL